jgi:GrpB-like predicted nucleotidyltransferase (UPF0157 family)
MPQRRSDPVVIEDYAPEWPLEFEVLRKVLVRHLGDVVRSVEHVGSTSVPGLAAKPIIDLDVVLASRDELAESIQRLAHLGYRHQGDLGVGDREAFSRDGASDVPRDGSGRAWLAHHLYVCPPGSGELDRHLAFRDWLRAHPEDARAYAELKRGLASRFRANWDAYVEGKTEFIESILKRAGASSSFAS